MHLKTNDVISKAIEIHANKFNYSKFVYSGMNKKSIIICNNCKKEFLQRVNNHINLKNGCPFCSHPSKKTTLEEFIKKAEAVHNNKYTYDKFMYKNNRTKGNIYCNNCKKEFFQTPTNHLKGHGCPNCKATYLSKFMLSNKKEFIKKAEAVHNNNYDYSKFKYETAKTKSIIICNNCFERFLQNANCHLRGQGCPNCNISKGENIIKQFLQKNNISFEPQKRFKECRDVKPLPFDFYLPEKNVLIEYDGEQHFENRNFFGGEKEFSTLKKHDLIKTKYANNNNINLIRISYKQINETESILKKIIA